MSLASSVCDLFANARACLSLSAYVVIGRFLQNPLFKSQQNDLLQNTDVFVILGVMNTPNPLKPLERAIQIAGSQTELARRAREHGGKISQQYIWHWLNVSNGRVPVEHLKYLSLAVDNLVTPADFRPDLADLFKGTE